MAAAQQLAPVDQEPEQALTWLPVEEDRARNGWRPFRPTQPCGLSDCKTPRDFSHSTEPKLVVEPCDDLRPETARIFQEFIDQEDIEISRHEIAHAFMDRGRLSRVPRSIQQAATFLPLHGNGGVRGHHHDHSRTRCL
jgi:hypothetical protein